MSANIYWNPVVINKKYCNVNCPSQFIEQACAVFGSFPITLSLDEHGQKVSTLAAINDDWSKIHDVLLDNENIILTAEY